MAHVVMQAFIDAGLITAEENVSRLVLDLKAGELAVMHVQRFGDKRLLSVMPTLEGVEIRREESATAGCACGCAVFVQDPNGPPGQGTHLDPRLLAEEHA